MPDKEELPDHFCDTAVMMLDASLVLTTAAICEESLAGWIRVNMRPLTKMLRAKIFTG
jgi:hypothetical protein